MTILERQTKGIISLSIILAMIPFFFFYLPPFLSSEDPVFSRQDEDSIILELVLENGESGIYFVQPDTGIRQVLTVMGISPEGIENVRLESGMKITLVRNRAGAGIVMGKMDAAKRLALELPVDINLISRDELMMIPGLGGGKLAESILAFREQNGKFTAIDQLMNIKGIKEKKLTKLKKYLYVEKRQNTAL